MTFELEKILTSLKTDNEAGSLLLSNWNEVRNKNISEIDFYNLLTATTATQLPASSASETAPMESVEQWTRKDLRIRSMWLEGYRGIPTSCDNGIEYGISMYPDLKNSRVVDPFSMVLLGSNGSGKTSIYSAMELLCLGSTSIAKKHHVKESSFEKFYHHLSRESNTMKISILFNDDSVISISDKRELGKVSSHVDLSAFFCSESDIAMFECSGESVATYLDHQIGLAELIEASKFIGKVISYIEQKDENPDQEIHDEHYYSKLQALQDTINENVRRIRSEILPSAQNILNELLKDYTDDVVGLSNTNILSENNNGEEISLFNGKLVVKEDKSEIEPRDYFNNFRFKLYLMSLRIAIAFQVMRTRHISFPLMFDDVFDSSDFTNRVKTNKFINKIFDLYKKLGINDNPLQIIFFTQDEVIAESVYEGIISSAENPCQKPNAMFVRLFSVFPDSEIIKDDDIRIENEDWFYNLYDSIRINMN